MFKVARLFIIIVVLLVGIWATYVTQNILTLPVVTGILARVTKQLIKLDKYLSNQYK